MSDTQTMIYATGAHERMAPGNRRELRPFDEVEWPPAMPEHHRRALYAYHEHLAGHYVPCGFNEFVLTGYLADTLGTGDTEHHPALREMHEMIVAAKLRRGDITDGVEDAGTRWDAMLQTADSIRRPGQLAF